MKKIYLCLVFLLFSLITINTYCCEETEPIPAYRYNNFMNCQYRVDFDYWMDAECKIHYKIMSLFFTDLSCYESLGSVEISEFFNFVDVDLLNYLPGMFPIPPCDPYNPMQVRRTVFEKYSCTSLSSDGLRIIFNIKCEGSKKCTWVYASCKEETAPGSGIYYIKTTLQVNYTENGNNCPKPSEVGLVWYDANNNVVLGNPWDRNLHPLGPDNTRSQSIVWPIHTDCLNFGECE